jgi:hypothetical protein
MDVLEDFILEPTGGLHRLFVVGPAIVAIGGGVVR